jgi:hypothetical protein
MKHLYHLQLSLLPEITHASTITSCLKYGLPIEVWRAIHSLSVSSSSSVRFCLFTLAMCPHSCQPLVQSVSVLNGICGTSSQWIEQGVHSSKLLPSYLWKQPGETYIFLIQDHASPLGSDPHSLGHWTAGLCAMWYCSSSQQAFGLGVVNKARCVTSWCDVVRHDTPINPEKCATALTVLHSHSTHIGKIR